MKTKQNSICPAIRELERIYDLIADRYKFTARRPIITIQSKGRGQTLGWHWTEKWSNGDDIKLSEINICAEVLNRNPIETLIHEMAHYHNCVDKIPDCSASQYHNKAFRERAENYGLNVQKAGRFGWAMTCMSDKLKLAVEEMNVNYNVFKMVRKESSKIAAPTKMKKFNCGCTVVRCATELSAVCELCQKRFEEEK